MRPIVATVRAIISRTASPRERSAPSCATCTPNSASRLERMRSMSCASPKPFSTMSAPCRASALAMPRPIPLVEPVTTAIFPFNMGEIPYSVGASLDPRHPWMLLSNALPLQPFIQALATSKAETGLPPITNSRSTTTRPVHGAA
ncbi:hypothetical protein D3C71_944590 [compost metagenome]